jgi:hypothetical protein
MIARLPKTRTLPCTVYSLPVFPLFFSGALYMNKRLFRVFLFSAVLLLAVAVLTPVHAEAGANGESAALSPAFSDFVKSVKNGEANTVRGVYVEGSLAFPVIQQPVDNGGYVSKDANVVTQYRAAARYGTIGLLAHNYLAGANFESLAVGKKVQIVYGNGRIDTYEITSIYRYQALQPNSGSSPFVNLADGKTYTAWDVFQLVYTGGDHITFQTCIESNGVSSWGRLFIIATTVPDSGLTNSY